MTKQVLNRGTIANDGTGDTLRTSALKIQQNFDEIYNKLGDGSVLMSLIDFDSSAIVFEGLSANNFETRLRATDPTQDREVFIPNYGGELVMDSATQTLANKTLTSPVLTTPQLNDTSANHQYVFEVSELSADRTVTLPLLTGDDEFTFNSHTQTLANKTIQAPTINSPIIGDEIRDSSGNELIVFTGNGSAVNYVNIENTNTGVPVIIQGAGEANTSLSLQGTGNGGVRINSRLALKTQGLNAAGTVSAGDPVTLFNNASPASHSLANGTTSVNGEIKYLVNLGAGTQTINETSNNLTAYSSITMTQNDAVTLLWFGSQWIVVNNQGATLNV